MAENGKKEVRGKKDTMRISKFSRRQFLQRAGMAAGGAAIASISLASACKSPADSAPTTSSGTTASGAPASSSTSLTSVTDSVPITGYSYVPPNTLPQLLTIPDSTCVVATDRVYSEDHIWVKSLSGSIAVMGITSVMERLLWEPFKISLPKTGSKLTQANDLGTIEGYKISADLISPVSGTVLQINDFLLTLMNRGTVLEPVINDPYNGGWMLVVELSKPDELKALLTAQSYRDLVKKK